MGLHKRGSVWWMCFTDRGKHYRKPTGATSKKLAQKILKGIEGEIVKGEWFEKIPGKDKTLKEAVDKYLKRPTGRVPGSRHNDRCISNTLLGFFDPDIRILQITPSLIADYKEKRIQQGIGPGSINNELILLKLLWKKNILFVNVSWFPRLLQAGRKGEARN